MLIDKFEFNSINCQLLRAEIDNTQFDLSENSDFDLLFCLNSMYANSYKKEKVYKITICIFRYVPIIILTNLNQESLQISNANWLKLEKYSCQ